MADLAAQKAEMERKLAELQRAIDDSADDETKERRAFTAKVETILRGKALHNTNIAEVVMVVMAVLQAKDQHDDSSYPKPAAVPVQ
jgi:hypothetical protein